NNLLDCPDSDGDGFPNNIDAVDGDHGNGDSDGDGLNDNAECPHGVPCPDSDGDGIPDILDPSPESPPKVTGCSANAASIPYNSVWIVLSLLGVSGALLRRRRVY